jgi:hypothetical protein
VRDLHFVSSNLETRVTPEPSLLRSKSTVLGLTVSALVQWPVEFFFPSVLPCPVPYDNKIELQIAPPTDAQRSAEARHRKFEVRELALAFTAQHSPRARINTPQLHTPHLKLLIASDNPTRIVILSDQRESKGLSFRSLQLKPSRSRLPRPPWRLIANPELEFLPSHTKRDSLRFSNRKKIAVFGPRPNPPIGEPKKLLSSLVSPDDRRRRRRPSLQHISNRNSRFAEFRSTYCKHTSYQISNRNKNASFAFPGPRIASHESHAANHDSRITTRAAFRSTIPARPHADR